MKRWFYTITFFVFISSGTAKAQNQIYGPARGLGLVYEISSDGRYVVGMTQTMNGAGFVWDTRKGTTAVTFSTHTYSYCVTNDRMVIGNFPDNINGMALVSAGYSTEGTAWTGLGLGLIANPESDIDGSSARRVTPDGKLIVGYSRKDTGTRKIYVPYAWRQNDAREWTGEEWAHPENAIQGYIIDISDAGNTGVGFIHNGTQRVAALWKSPSEYDLPFSPDLYSEFLCISGNGKYAGGSYGGGRNGSAIACLYDIENEEIIPIPEAFRVTSVSNNGFATGIYRLGSLDRIFIWNRKMGFMDFGDFLTAYATGLDLSTDPELQAVLTDKTRTFMLNAVTPDGSTFAICIPEGISGSAYTISIAPVTVYPYPRNLTADVPVKDRNKVILNWEAPNLDGEPLTGYAVYRGTRLLETVDSETFTYTDLNVSPGFWNYTVKAVYEGDGYSNASNTARAVVVNNYSLPLIENFDRLSLAYNYWTTENSRTDANMGWNVYSDAGAGGGTGLRFHENNMDGLSDKSYSSSLISKYLDGTGAEKIYLSFLVKPDYYPERDLTPDTLSIDVYDGNTWKTVDKYTFRLAMEWKADIIDLSEVAGGKFFKVRFRITGENRTVSAKYIHFDDIVIATTAPAGNAIPQELLAKAIAERNCLLVWQNPHTNLYALTYANSPKRYSIGNEVPFIAANRFDASDLEIYKGKYLTSISAYINKKTATQYVYTLKLAVFADGERIVDQPISTYKANAWNTFYPDSPVLLDGKNLIFGIEVVRHEAADEPIGVDGARKAFSGKGDIYSEDGGHTWKSLTDAGLINNWCITGNVSSAENAEVKPSDIAGYNVYYEGEKLNDDLIFGQSFETDKIGNGYYTVRAYSLASGISAESHGRQIVTGIVQPKPAVNVEIYPNPVRDVLFIRSEAPVESLVVYDLYGRVCKQGGQGITALSAADLKDGVYVVRIKTAAGELVKKIQIIAR